MEYFPLLSSLYSYKQSKHLKQVFLKVGGMWVKTSVLMFFSQLNRFFKLRNKELGIIGEQQWCFWIDDSWLIVEQCSGKILSVHGIKMYVDNI